MFICALCTNSFAHLRISNVTCNSNVHMYNDGIGKLCGNIVEKHIAFASRNMLCSVSK